MIVTLTNNQVVRKDPLGENTGFRARQISIEKEDWARFRSLMDTDPDRLDQIMESLGKCLVRVEMIERIDRAREALRTLADDFRADPQQTMADYQEEIMALYEIMQRPEIHVPVRNTDDNLLLQMTEGLGKSSFVAPRSQRDQGAPAP